MRTTILGLLVSLVCAALGGGAAWLLAEPDVAEPTSGSERAGAAVDAFRDAHVYVAPGVRDAFTEQELARIDEAAAASDPPVYLVVWRASHEAGYGSRDDVLREIGNRLDQPGVYLEVDPSSGVDSTEVNIEGAHFSFFESIDQWSGEQVADGLVEQIESNSGRSYEVVDTSPTSDYWGGPTGTVAAGLLLGVLCGGAVGVGGIVVWLVLRRKRITAAQERART